MKARLLTYLEDDTTVYVDFNFVLSDIQACYISPDTFHFCIVLSGSIYELIYSVELERECKKMVSFKDNFNQLMQ